MDLHTQREPHRQKIRLSELPRIVATDLSWQKIGLYKLSDSVLTCLLDAKEVQRVLRFNQETAMKSTICFVPREVFSQTKLSLETLYERTETPFNLVCVDGNSPPKVAQYLQHAAAEKGFTLLRTDQYLTPNQARNLAANWAWENTDSPWVVFVDNDVMVSQGWLSALERCAEETDAWLVGPAYFEGLPERNRLHLYGGKCKIETDADGNRRYFEKHDHQHQPIEKLDQPLERCRTELIEFHTLLVRRQVYQQLGPLDEGLMCHAEHGDLCLSVLQAGGTIWLEPDSEITYVPPKKLAAEDREFFFLRWSEAWMAANQKHFSDKWQLAHVKEAPGRGRDWVAQHRRYGLACLPAMRKIIGRKLTRSIEKRVVAPLERLANERTYPLASAATLPTPSVQLIHSPQMRHHKAVA